MAIGEQGIIQQDVHGKIPLKLLEMGCFPGATVELIQIAPFKDPLYIRVNGSHLAIRKETAELVEIEISENLCETLKL